MPEKLPDFNSSQWEFISIMEALDEPVSVDVIGSLVPLPPGEFLDLLRKCDHIDWVHRSDDDIFSLAADMPKKVKSELENINSTKRISDLIDSLEKNGMVDAVSPSALAKCLQKTGKFKKALRLEMEMAIV